MLQSIKLIFILSVIYLCKASEEDVLDLTDDNFQSDLENHDVSLVMFYAPWCGHCKRLKPEFAQAAGILKGDDPPVTLVKVDCTEGGKSTCEKHGVSGYPTLKIFRKGQHPQEYNGPRESNGIVKYMRSQVGPSSKELLTVTDFDAITSKDEVVIIGFFETETDLKAEFLSLADRLRERFIFAHTSSKDVLTKAGYTDAVVVYRPKRLHNKFEDPKVAYVPKEKSLKEFVIEASRGLAGIRTKDNAEDFEAYHLITVYYDVDYVKNPKGTHYWRNRVLKVAQQMPDIRFAISNGDDFVNELKEFGIDFDLLVSPGVVARDGEGKKYVMRGEFSVENLLNFAQELVGNKIKPYIKSEALPANNDGPVKIAVGDNFEKLVTESDKDALIEFYAPWCGHCQKLSPIWDELGEKLKNENVDIIKMDATANDWPKTLFEVNGFPTIYWKTKNKSDKPVKYNGGRALDDFLKYVAEHASEELTGWDRNGKVKAKEEL